MAKCSHDLHCWEYTGGIFGSRGSYSTRNHLCHHREEAGQERQDHLVNSARPWFQEVSGLASVHLAHEAFALLAPGNTWPVKAGQQLDLAADHHPGGRSPASSTGIGGFETSLRCTTRITIIMYTKHGSSAQSSPSCKYPSWPKSRLHSCTLCLVQA